ncbi:hypothetical protein [Myxacorys almedinensis]|uniref:Uncharacterized protein n=1 Tax=Myxacorys almedinensis A TaxID=2690445 RepID=A0A8J7Z9R8_9CYAN|nr:hypothetical protein [Myxacorys almedinensis]NDJ19033.1 hypothetical protein [Myxacorys almedinensis A]
MTELKADSQSTQIPQDQPSPKKRRTSRLAKEPTAQPEVNPETADAASAEATPKRKRQSSAKSSPKTKPQTALKSKQTSSTPVKPIWEVSRSTIAAQPAPREHDVQQFRQQIASILEEMLEDMEGLKAIAQDIESPDQRASGVELPVYPPKSVAPPPAAEPPLPRPEAMNGTTQMPSSPIPALSLPPHLSQPPRRRVRRRTLKSIALRIWQRVVKLPPQPSEVALDAVLWIGASTGLRYGLYLIASSLPVLGLPIALLVFVPALMAIYAALFLPQVSPIILYRLLLITAGLVIGGKLL